MKPLISDNLFLSIRPLKQLKRSACTLTEKRQESVNAAHLNHCAALSYIIYRRITRNQLLKKKHENLVDVLVELNY